MAPRHPRAWDSLPRRMKIGVPKETAGGERRVALIPEAVKKLVGQGLEVVVERGAGDGALIPDATYEEAGATLADASAVWGADVVVKVAPPSAEESARLGSESVLIGFLAPLSGGESVKAIASSGATSFAMEAVPRISRAQSMDALSSQSNVSGYRAALVGAQELGRFYPMLMTAAGTIRPATVLVLGAGVAGLQAIATARRLGAVVQGFDVRAAVKEQVESLGAHFLEFDLGGDLEGAGGYAKELTSEQQARQQELMAEAIGKVDVVITTALVPGRRAPILVTEEAVKKMKPGSVIVDLAGEAGGNCELTVPGETVLRHGVKIVAPLNLPSTMAEHASQLYARNIQSLLELMIDEGALKLDFDDEIIAGACVTRGGEIVHAGAKAAAGAQ
jgi:NAD(P) transhydrogenase subunit alpha